MIACFPFENPTFRKTSVNSLPEEINGETLMNAGDCFHA